MNNNIVNNLIEVSNELTNIELSVQRKYLIDKLYLEFLKNILNDSYKRYNNIILSK